MTSSVGAIDESIRVLLDELEAMDSGRCNNDMLFTQQQVTDNNHPVQESSAAVAVNTNEISGSGVTKPQNRKRKITKKDASVQTTTTTSYSPQQTVTDYHGWVMKLPQDAPFITWTDPNFQYTVQNATNNGNVLLKLQLFNCGKPINSCGVYVDETRDKNIYTTLTKLLSQLKHLWLNINENGGEVPKIDGLIQTVTPLASWRKNCTTVVGGGGKRAASRSRNGGSASRDTTQVRRENKRPKTLALNNNGGGGDLP